MFEVWRFNTINKLDLYDLSSLPDLKRFIKEMVHSGGELNDVVRVLEEGKSILTIIIDKNNKKIVKNAVDRRDKRKWNDWLRRPHSL